MSLPYRKHYPAARPARRHLLDLLRRAPGRRARWAHQAQRRRPWLLRPLTAGEQNLFRYKGMAQELARLLAPFRRTRTQGHRELQDLLFDADTRPLVVAQMQELAACFDRVQPEYRRQDQQIARWRDQWPRLTPAGQKRLSEEDKAVVISCYHDGVHLLLEEAKRDTARIKALCPEAFAPTPAPEPWLASSPPNSPGAYSA